MSTTVAPCRLAVVHYHRYSRQTPSIIRPDMPSFSVAHQLIPPDLDIQRPKIPTLTSQKKASSKNPNPKILKSVNGKSTKRIHRPGLDNQVVHTNPAADRELKKALVRTRKTSEISSWACLACWIRHKVCKKSLEGPCEDFEPPGRLVIDLHSEDEPDSVSEKIRMLHSHFSSLFGIFWTLLNRAAHTTHMAKELAYMFIPELLFQYGSMEESHPLARSLDEGQTRSLGGTSPLETPTSA
ncbi:hypothetical protein T440DRAFT_478702 [Plenodomus tracheiphilus IPT5]|uniref:Uncharacterized protein n=1 Tax=Plenodomus tracheiphilus IPT5 TaxID=1408161 RepID=A0A6A7B939_9PLEO|nr:hypothetical protein T440DRAFT_478702 [Plenodomus tracheiphilus IPT5]